MVKAPTEPVGAFMFLLPASLPGSRCLLRHPGSLGVSVSRIGDLRCGLLRVAVPPERIVHVAPASGDVTSVLLAHVH